MFWEVLGLVLGGGFWFDVLLWTVSEVEFVGVWASKTTCPSNFLYAIALTAILVVSSFALDTTHLAYNLLRIVKNTYGREILVNAWDIQSLETDLILILPLLLVWWHSHAFLNCLNHTSMEFKTVLTTFVAIWCDLCPVVILGWYRSSESWVLEMLELFLVLSYRVVSFMQRREIVHGILNISLLHELNRIIDCLILILKTWWIRWDQHLGKVCLIVRCKKLLNEHAVRSSWILLSTGLHHMMIWYGLKHLVVLTVILRRHWTALRIWLSVFVQVKLFRNCLLWAIWCIAHLSLSHCLFELLLHSDLVLWFVMNVIQLVAWFHSVLNNCLGPWHSEIRSSVIASELLKINLTAWIATRETFVVVDIKCPILDWIDLGLVDQRSVAHLILILLPFLQWIYLDLIVVIVIVHCLVHNCAFRVVSLRVEDKTIVLVLVDASSCGDLLFAQLSVLALSLATTVARLEVVALLFVLLGMHWVVDGFDAFIIAAELGALRLSHLELPLVTARCVTIRLSYHLVAYTCHIRN